MTRLSNRQLLRQLGVLCDQECATKLKVLLLLGEVERRKLHLKLGYGSLFAFATQHLRYSESAAGRRVQVARCIARYPQLVGMFRRREVNLSTLSLISRVLNDDNEADVLTQIRNKSQRDVEAIVAMYEPARRFRDRIRPIVVRVPETSSVPGDDASDGQKGLRARDAHDPDCDNHANSNGTNDNGDENGDDNGDGDGDGDRRGGRSDANDDSRSGSSSTTGARPVRAQDQGVRHEQRFAVNFAATSDFMKKLDEARALMSSGHTRRGIADVLEVTLDAYLDRHSPKRRAARREGRNAQAQARQQRKLARGDGAPAPVAVVGPRAPDTATTEAVAPEAAARSAGRLARERRAIPIADRDAVFVRDDGRCAYVGESGQRCASTHGLEIDHVTPVGRRGANEVANLRLLCAPHNLLEAERIYGTDWMQQFRT